jgi:hypothetical protein
VTVINPADKDATRTFTYDSVFGITATQKAIYTKTAFPLVENVLEGYFRAN